MCTINNKHIKQTTNVQSAMMISCQEIQLEEKKVKNSIAKEVW